MKIPEKTYYSLFRIGVVIKAAIALGELVVGTLVVFMSPERISNFIYAVAGVEFTEPQGGLIWKLVAGSLKDFTATSQAVWAFVFLSHGIVKMFLLGGLWKNKLWAYPTSALIFTGFVFYQLYELSVVPSILLWLITIFDIVLIWLIWHEYKVKRGLLPHNATNKI